MLQQLREVTARRTVCSCAQSRSCMWSLHVADGATVPTGWEVRGRPGRLDHSFVLSCTMGLMSGEGVGMPVVLSSVLLLTCSRKTRRFSTTVRRDGLSHAVAHGRPTACRADPVVVGANSPNSFAFHWSADLVEDGILPIRCCESSSVSSGDAEHVTGKCDRWEQPRRAGHRTCHQPRSAIALRTMVSSIQGSVSVARSSVISPALPQNTAVSPGSVRLSA